MPVHARGIDAAWAFEGSTGAGIDVAVVDSGVDASHPEVREVASAVALSWDRVEQQVLVEEGPHADLFGHGTACAGIVRRAAPDCRLHSVRVLGERLAGKGEVFAGVVLVCAVSNVPAPSYPSQFAAVISVAANDGTGPFDLDCNPSPPVDFGAPGIDVDVPWLGGATVRTTGNSFAAPHVTGLVARLLAKHPHLTPYEVKAVLRAVSRNAQPA